MLHSVQQYLRNWPLMVAATVWGSFCAVGQSLPSRQATVSSIRDSLSRHMTIEREAALDWALRNGFPSRGSSASGIWELERLDGNRPVYRQTHNATAARTTGTDLLHTPGLLSTPLTGQGMVLGIWDGGHVFAGHQEFGGRVTFEDGAPLEDHATHVGGTLAASGIRSQARGMAPDARLKSWDWNADAVEMIAAGTAGLLVSNHSYGPSAGWVYADLEGRGTQWYWIGDSSVNPAEDYTFGLYGREASRWDRVAWESPFLLPVVSAGNDRNDTGPASGTYRLLNPATGTYGDETVAQRFIPPDGGAYGYDTIAGQAVAKNVLTVGSVDDIGPGSDQEPSVSVFSSAGPTDDGRVKPDLVCNGESLLSTALGGVDAYRISSGTSMAAANCSGSLLLLQELQLAMAGSPLRAATLKGLALHTARDLGTPGPDYQTGWGLLDAAEAVRHLQSRLVNPVALLEETLGGASPVRLRLVKPEAGPIRLTLSWTDRPAEPQSPGSHGSRTPLLQWDLDMRLEHQESGQIWSPWVLNPDRPADAAFLGANKVDPVEQIRIDEAPAGSYVLFIGLDADSGADGPVPFSLQVTGLTDRTRFVSVPSLETRLEGSVIVAAWSALGQTVRGTYVLERASSPLEGVVDDSVFVFSVVDSVVAAASSEAYFELLDANVPVGPLRYRLLFRVPSLDPTVEARSEIFVPLADHDGISVAAATPDGVTLALQLTRVRADAEFRMERRTLSFDALGEVVLGPPFVVDPVHSVGRSESPVSLSWLDPLPAARRYRYSVQAVATDGTVFSLADADIGVPAPRQAAWVALFPNPVNARFEGVIDVAEERTVTFTVFDAVGRRVFGPESERMPAGRHRRAFDAADWAPGAYFLVLETGTTRRTHPIIRVR